MISRPIRTEAEYKEALAEIEQYFDREPKENTAEADRFDLPTLLIEAYEERHHPIGPPHPIEMIRHRMRTAGYTQADLADDLEAQSAMEDSSRGSGISLSVGGRKPPTGSVAKRGP
ncbi:MAG: XRE family transcriptional regulator [Reyranella sp.]|uniref:helix-turn-helix domain-containing protein n=1 Tax=Reyranella sp. TaxID=1929291 RepID=UPI001AD29D12|nr:XRE family transcriptional regulator [Reyranella sp.]MBN9089775.1 XRE family transcriptional regulator [Reyranella sp.]